jgi:hypothetical protein
MPVVKPLTMHVVRGFIILGHSEAYRVADAEFHFVPDAKKL